MKTLVTIMALSLATAFSANAQVNKKGERSATQSSTVQPQQDLSKQVQTHTDRMTRELELSPEQAQEIMSENKTLYSDMHASTMDNVNATDRERMSSRTIDNYDAKLENILDEGQYKKYQTMKAEYMKGFNTTAKVNKMDKNEKMEK